MPPLAFNCTLPPVQIATVCPASAGGDGFTVTVVVATQMAPLASVTVTV